MSTRLVLLCAAATQSRREPGFPGPADPLDAGGIAKARMLRLEGPAPERVMLAPDRAGRETAALLGLSGGEAKALAERDHGAWSGCGFDAIDPAALTAWLAAPEAAPPGGESMAAVAARVAPWLAALDGRVLAITHAAVIRAAIGVALDVPVAATLAIDVAPLTSVILSRHGRWRLRALEPR
ncbi:histidine phosphatase family protein [Sphingomonas abaci]|uniref:Broad specificity phosphatase PhoE n=1 Tax=Sphingomonas abaci TaxID=237611 RepID=A0A7W7EY08_9SPHN|nr:histidine phosphatase family protein [Sphingomonas abaci]MBB4618182.1 broad specificity phosphatase PhoE [Sphingomonas abaci]